MKRTARKSPEQRSPGREDGPIGRRPPDEGCQPLVIRGIDQQKCDPETMRTRGRLKGKIGVLVYPQSQWEANRATADAELRRTQAFYASYCIDLEFADLQLGATAKKAATTRRKLVGWYNDWYTRVVAAVGGEQNLGTTTIPSGLTNEFRTAMEEIQALAARKFRCLIVFIDEYVAYSPRISLVSATMEAFQQIGISWVDSRSPCILAHELLHALGKSAPGTPGPVTWTHNSPCPRALSTIQRTSSRTPIDLSGRYLELLEYQEIVQNKGGGVLK
jgi:hypothetical protein